MMRIRRKRQDSTPANVESIPESAVVPADMAQGPWDISQCDPRGAENVVDLGSLILTAQEGLEIQLPAEDDDNTIAAAVFVSDVAGLELRAFAAPKSDGLWNEVRAGIAAEVERLRGESVEVDGLLGMELHTRVPATAPDGSEAFQPSRILGIDGPRWLLRATFVGQAALEPSDEGPLMDALRTTVVVRGDEPKLQREPLLLKLPPEAIPSDERDSPREAQ